MKVLVQNRRARREYFVESTIEAGLVLLGSEVKAIRMGRVQLQEAFVELRNGEAWLVRSHVGEYPYARHYTHEARRDRKLLFNAAELRKLGRRVREKGYTLVPLDLHLTDRGLIKATIGVARGKRQVDRRETIKKRDQQRDMDRQTRGR